MRIDMLNIFLQEFKSFFLYAIVLAMKLRLRFLFPLILAGLLLTSCSGIMGYGVLLWSLPEKNLSDGDIVPVYILSNINNVYVIGIPGTDEKMEVPFWQITTPVSEKKAEVKQAIYADYQHQYATVMYDGLPMREATVNTSNQVYRLRKDETIKVLYKGEGQSPMTGGEPLPGDWLKVMASNGTVGWCFSYNLKIFDEREQDVAVETVTKKEDTLLETVLATRWWPENYGPLIKNNQINLEVIKSEYGFSTGLESGTTVLNMPDPQIKVDVPYEGVENVNSNVYKFINSPFTMTVRNENTIIIQYMNEKGMPTSYTLIALSEGVNTVIEQEHARREEVYNTLVAFGPQFTSNNYGRLTFISENQFTWNGYSKLVDSQIIPTRVNGRGAVEVKYFLTNELSLQFDGVLTFTFENSNKEINFLYQIESDGLRLESLSAYQIQEGIVSSRDTNSLVMFFARSGAEISSESSSSNATTSNNVEVGN